MKIGVFGCGNMGNALVLGMKSRFPDTEFFLFTPSHSKAEELAVRVGGTSLQMICLVILIGIYWPLNLKA
jgi:pyrroline-5-carboxylate reductase